MATIADLRAESLRLSRELRSHKLSAEQRATKKEDIDRINLRLTRAIAAEKEREREEERREQARRDRWLEAGASRRLRR